MIKQLDLFENEIGSVDRSRNSHGSVVGLFAGIGGVELGLSKAGWKSSLLCEIDPHARRVLSQNFNISESEIFDDVKKLKSIPKCDILAAGFPCQDLSQAGNSVGINGSRSGLVGEIFRLLNCSSPSWVLLENVPFMLSLDNGSAMSLITNAFEELGYTWAYRTINSRAFGVPHRRERVIFIASKKYDPRGPLLNQQLGSLPKSVNWTNKAVGFYWTEGLRGVGWAVNHVPPIKCGSTISIPSPPAVWMPNCLRSKNPRFIKPTILDAEKLQGFPKNWTEQAKYLSSNGERKRWTLVGNAVTVNVAEWIGERLAQPDEFNKFIENAGHDFNQNKKWPDSAWGIPKVGKFTSPISKWPINKRQRNLHLFLEKESRCNALSTRATQGFLNRFLKGNLSAGGARDQLISDLEMHIKDMN